MKNYDENNYKGYIFEVDVKYSKRLHELHSDLPFLSERMEVNKCKKLVCNLFNKKKYVAHINTLKQALHHGLKLKKIHRVIEFNQEAWLKPYIDKPKYNNDVKLCYMDTDSFIMNIKTNDFYKDIANDVENKFDTSN